ncbi:MAG: hypothetical protein JWN65_3063 [Solirubrobacterales bacterium]|jgi:uncharacterized cupredoxin-like copper-binding protein|nr:hypothetical protein [Solirubrobacterales bacterium]
MRRLHQIPLLCLALAGSAVSGCGNDDSASGAAPPGTTASAQAPATATSPGTVQVALTEYKIAASAATAPAGKVTFDVSNDGAIPHEFVVLKTDTKAAGLMKGAKADETGNVGELDEKALAVKAGKPLTLDLQPGHYALICNLPGHYQGGMHTDFTVK